MIGSDVLLFPDTGAGFLKSLRFNAIYCSGVHVLTNSQPEFVEILRIVGTNLENGLTSDTPEAHDWSVLGKRLKEYSGFLAANAADLQMLQVEGVLSTLGTLQQLPHFLQCTSAALSSFVDQIKWDELDASACLKFVDPCRAALAVCPPALFDLDLLSDRLHEECVKTAPAGRLTRDLEAFLLYMFRVIAFAESRGCIVSTWNPLFHGAVWSTREFLLRRTADVPDFVSIRSDLRTQLGQIVIRKYFPKMDDLPFHELLEIRRKRRDELRSFWVAVAEAVVKIDPAERADRRELLLQELVSTSIDPAVESLRRALADARWSALKKLGQSWDALAKATVPAALAFAAGASLDVITLFGSTAVAAAALYEGEIERKRLLHGSQWSLLLELEHR